MISEQRPPCTSLRLGESHRHEVYLFGQPGVVYPAQPDRLSAIISGLSRQLYVQSRLPTPSPLYFFSSTTFLAIPDDRTTSSGAHDAIRASSVFGLSHHWVPGLRSYLAKHILHTQHLSSSGYLSADNMGFYRERRC